MKPMTLEELANSWEKKAEDCSSFVSSGTLMRCARELREFSAWRPIETAPKDGTEFWAWRDDSGVMQCEWLDNALFANWGSEDITDDPPTYWQPLPAPPKGETV